MKRKGVQGKEGEKKREKKKAQGKDNEKRKKGKEKVPGRKYLTKKPMTHSTPRMRGGMTTFGGSKPVQLHVN